MIIIMKPGSGLGTDDCHQVMKSLEQLPAIEAEAVQLDGTSNAVTEIMVTGDDLHSLEASQFEGLPGVAKVVLPTHPYRILGRHDALQPAIAFEYNGVTFGPESFHVFAGLCAVDGKSQVDATFKALGKAQQVCARMGVYKPRTNPYTFQGMGDASLPYVFESAGKHGIKVIAMEVTHEAQLSSIDEALRASGNATGVMVQVGTRNVQNFELLKAIGGQTQFPILFKRGFGITLEESLSAAEYCAKAGNPQIIFCMRGVKTMFAAPHRNLVDFGQIAAVKRLTRMPVGIDPSHSVGLRAETPHGTSDIYDATAQGVIAGANMVLVDFHPNPPTALVDAKQALPLSDLSWYLADVEIAREAYLKRKALAQSSH